MRFDVSYNSTYSIYRVVQTTHGVTTPTTYYYTYFNQAAKKAAQLNREV